MQKQQKVQTVPQITQKDLETYRQDALIKKCRFKKDNIDERLFRLNKDFYNFIDEDLSQNKVLKELIIKNNIALQLPQEQRNSEEDQIRQLQITEIQSKIQENEQKFLEFLENWLNSFEKYKDKEYFQIPEKVSLDWKQKVFEKCQNRQQLTFFQSFEKQKKYCIVWKKNSTFDQELEQQVQEYVEQYEQNESFTENQDKNKQSRNQRKQRQNSKDKEETVDNQNNWNDLKDQKDINRIEDDKQPTKTIEEYIKQQNQISQNKDQKLEENKQNQDNQQSGNNKQGELQNQQQQKQDIKQEKQNIYQQYDIQDCPDRIEGINICQIDVQTQQIKINFILPENNGGEITEINLYQQDIYKQKNILVNKFMLQKEKKELEIKKIDEENQQILITINYNKLQKNFKQFIENLNLKPENKVKIPLYLQLSCQNQYGESQLSDTLKFLINDYNNKNNIPCHLIIAGQDENQEIPLDYEVKGQMQEYNFQKSCLKEFKEIDFGQKGIFQDIALTNQGLASTSLGECAHWGLINLTEDENLDQVFFTPEEAEKLLIEEKTTPYNPLGSSQNIIQQVACGIRFYQLLTIDGKLLGCGDNQFGQLGLSHYSTVLEPQFIDYFQKKQIFITDIQAGARHCAAITEKKEVYSWGFKQAKFGTNIKNRFNDTVNIMNIGQSINTPEKQEIIFDAKQISAYGNNTAVVTYDKQLYTWGDNEYQQLGLNQQPSNIVLAQSVQSQRYQFLQVSQGLFHTLAIVEDIQQNNRKKVIGLGNHKQGQLGFQLDSDHDYISSLLEIDFFNKKEWNIIDISCGSFHSFVIIEEDSNNKKIQRVFAFGNCEFGQLGNQDINDQVCVYEPIEITESIKKSIGYSKNDNINVKKIAAGFDNTAILISDKKFFEN